MGMRRQSSSRTSRPASRSSSEGWQRGGSALLIAFTAFPLQSHSLSAAHPLAFTAFPLQSHLLSAAFPLAFTAFPLPFHLLSLPFVVFPLPSVGHPLRLTALPLPSIGHPPPSVQVARAAQLAGSEAPALDMRPGHYSHWPDCHFADALSLHPILKRLPKVEGRATE